MNNHLNITKGRIEFVDAIRGFAIFLVVFHHITVCITGAPSLISDFCIYWRMPMFFFISGFLINSLVHNSDMLGKRLYNRLTRQLYPTLVIFCIYIIFTSTIEDIDILTNFKGGVISTSKCGYWFTISLFEVFLFYSFVIWLFRKLKAKRQIKIISIFVLTALFFSASFVIEGSKLGHGKIGMLIDIMSLTPTLQLSCFFFFGVICGIYQQNIIRIATRSEFLFLSLITFLICINIELRAFYILSRISGITTVFSLFAKLQQHFSTSLVLSHLKSIGKLTLPIYLFHYFVLLIIAQSESITDVLIYFSSNHVSQTISYTALSLAIIFITLAINRALKYKPIVHRLLFFS